MAQDKKSFIMYCEWLETFEELTDEEAGRLIKHIFNYVNDTNPEAPDKYTKMCFIPIKQALKRDLVKYDRYISKQKVNGAKGGRPKKTQITQPFISKPKKADNVNVNVNVKDITTITINMRESEFKNSLQPFLKDFGKDVLNKFYLYWTEKKPRGKKMRYEMEKTFDIGRRLERWNSNNFNTKSDKDEKRKKLEQITAAINNGKIRQ